MATSSAKDLTTGPIFSSLVRLSLPIIATAFIQMAYNLTDAMWLGRLGSTQVTAVTTAGFFMWLLLALFSCTKAGTESLVAQAVGRKDSASARRIATTALTSTLAGSLLLNLVVFLFAPSLLQVFELAPEVLATASSYLRLVAPGMVLAVAVPVLSAIFLAHGDSKTVFYLNGLGLIINMALDPLLIFGFAWLPGFGADGAAVATVAANTLVFLALVKRLRGSSSVMPAFSLRLVADHPTLLEILKVGLPVAAHQTAFCLISITIGSLVSRYGTIPLGVQNIGMEIEALSWHTALGFATALTAFTGQNYGAGAHERIRRGYLWVLGLSCSLGLVATIAFLSYGGNIYGIFSQEPEMINTGRLYLQILALSQIFMCLEITAAGGFYGLGKSRPPALTSILFTGLRIPAALVIINFTDLAYAGVWWCISISSVLKGIIVATLYQRTLARLIGSNTASAKSGK